MSFFTGFATGFANTANEISRDRERQRNRNLEQAMERFSNTIERRREELRTLQQQRQQARILAASVPGISPTDAEGFVFAGQFDAAMRGQFTPVGAPAQGQPAAAPAPSAPPVGGLGSPPAQPTPTPVAAQAAPAMPQAAPAMPQAAPAMPQGVAAPTPVADPREAATPSMGQRIQQAMFGRDPFQGVESEVRERYMRESGMTREQLDQLTAPPREPPEITGRYQYNQFTPQQEAQMAQLFVDRAGYERAKASGWRDLSGIATMSDVARLQAMIRAAGAGAGGHNITPAFNAALRAAGSVIPSIGNGLLRQHIDPVTGQVSIAVAVPSSDPRYAQGVQAQMAFMGALGTALRGEVSGVPPLDPGAALNYALRQANQVPGINPRPNPQGATAPRAPSLAEARARQGSPVAPDAPFQPIGASPSVSGASEIPQAPARPGSSRNNPVDVTTPEEAARLPIGTWVRTPSGQVRQRE